MVNAKQILIQRRRITRKTRKTTEFLIFKGITIRNWRVMVNLHLSDLLYLLKIASSKFFEEVKCLVPRLKGILSEHYARNLKDFWNVSVVFRLEPGAVGWEALWSPSSSELNFGCSSSCWLARRVSSEECFIGVSSPPICAIHRGFLESAHALWCTVYFVTN